jgi:hypothetical protein
MLPRLKLWFRKTFWAHKWKYRNPYNRSCVTCGRHEIEFSDNGKKPFDRTRGRHWWEAYNEGDETKHYTPKNKGD